MYSSQDLNTAQKLLEELFVSVSTEESTLAGGKNLGIGSRTIKALRNTRISFGNPANDLVRLTEKLFDEVGVKLDAVMKKQMRNQYDFYYMTLTLSMQPGRGVKFNRVECTLDFGPKGKDEPIIQTIIPQPELKELLKIGGKVKLAIDGKLNWRVGMAPSVINQITSVPGKVNAKIANENSVGGYIIVPEYTFGLRCTEIAATGEGNSQCFWRIESPELKIAQAVKLGVVFKVPKGKTSISLTGLVLAEPNLIWMLTNLRIVFEHLSVKLQRLLALKNKSQNHKNPFPLGSHEQWNIMLPN